jgi:hypothetical protein
MIDPLRICGRDVQPARGANHPRRSRDDDMRDEPLAMITSLAAVRDVQAIAPEGMTSKAARGALKGDGFHAAPAT